MLALKKRSNQLEIMDDFEMKGELLRKTLDQIAWINRWLGGNHVTRNGIRKLLRNVSVGRELCIIDLGCGNGDMLRLVADQMRKEKRKVRLIGIDANEFTIKCAQELSIDYPEISFLKEMIPSSTFSNLEYDIVLSTLFIHHFSDIEIIDCLRQVGAKARLGVVINDLQRSRLSIVLFRLLSIFIANPMVRKDGVTSIMRGFKKKELVAYSKELQQLDSEIRWKWAFRYQWIIKKN